MSRKMISCLFLLFIIIVSLVFSHFTYIPSIESFDIKGILEEGGKEDTLLNPEEATGPAPAPASDNIKAIQSGYGILTEGFGPSTPSPEGIFDHLIDKMEKSTFSLLKF
jgi:hypothetical protein